MKFLVEPYRLQSGLVEIAATNKRQAPLGWQPNPKLPLHLALPTPWPDRYLREGQDFAPHAFMHNCCQLANYAYEKGISDDLNFLISALTDRFLSQCIEFNGALFLRFDFLKSYRDVVIHPPWVSGHAQGCGLIGFSVLAKVLNSEKFYTILEKLFKAFLCPKVEGELSTSPYFVTYIDTNGFLWIEEYPLYTDPQPHVLNGHIRGIGASHRGCPNFMPRVLNPRGCCSALSEG